jgi:hypothetical protein
MYASPPAFVACGYVVDHPAALAKTCARKKKKQVILVVVPVPRLQGQFVHLHKFLCSGHGLVGWSSNVQKKLTIGAQIKERDEGNWSGPGAH